MRVKTNNNFRTIYEMNDMFEWLTATFGLPGTFTKQRWTYGKEPDWNDSVICNGPHDIEWIDFENEADATVFVLKWGDTGNEYLMSRNER